MTDIILTGLDGSNPLGFLAGLGVLNVLTEHGDATLAWRTGDWRASLTADGVTSDDLIRILTDETATWKDDPCLALKYPKPASKGSRAGKAKVAWDLKPPPEMFRWYVENLVARGDPARRRSMDFAAAFATETAQDNNGNTKPTALHFTAGQQQFLEMVSQLRASVMPDDFREAIFGPWRYERDLPVLGWDCTAARMYALRADDPSIAEKRGVPGADWLAFRGLSFIRVAPIGGQIVTTGCAGGWKTGAFRWPVWTASLTKDTIQSLLQVPGLPELSEPERRARGIAGVFECSIRRSEQGGYGSFTPSTAM